MASQDYINALHSSTVIRAVNKADASDKFYRTPSNAPEDSNTLFCHCSHCRLLVRIDSVLQEADSLVDVNNRYCLSRGRR